MAKLSYVISKNSKRAGKRGVHFDGSGSGNWFQQLFSKGENKVPTEKSEIRDLVSKLVLDGDGSYESNSETRVEIEGSSEEIREFANWSVEEIKANSESLKNVAVFIKDYCKALKDVVLDTYKEINEENESSKDIETLKERVSNLEEAAADSKAKKAKE